jgi:FG-GAP repeat protein
VAFSANGSTIVAGAPFFGNASANLAFLGEAWVWQQPATGWANNSNPNAVLLAPNAQQNDFFATSAAISADAKTIVIGATGYKSNRGAAFVFTSPSGVWTSAPPPAATLMSSDGQPEQVGWSVATNGSIVVSGTPFVTIGGNTGQGAAYVFVEPATGWRNATETQKLFATDGKAGDGLGQSVGLSNGTVLGAAPDVDVSGVQDTGAIYAFGSFPAIGISLAPAAPDGSNGWYRHPVRVAVSASDLASTVAAIRCVLDPARAPASFGALPASCGFLAPGGGSVTANGRHILYAAASNTAGYAASPTSRSVQIDTVAPRVRCEPTPAFVLRGRGGLVTAKVTDATSGAAVPLIARRAKVSRTGKKTATLTGRDNAGNATTVRCRYTVVASRIPTFFIYTFSAGSKFTIFDSLVAKKVPKGATLKVTCTGRGCPFKRRVIHTPTTRLVCKAHHKHCKKKPAPRFKDINLKPLVREHHFAVKAKLTLTVTKPNTIGVTQTFTIRSSARPAVRGPNCLAPGSSKPGKGC